MFLAPPPFASLPPAVAAERYTRFFRKKETEETKYVVDFQVRGGKAKRYANLWLYIVVLSLTVETLDLKKRPPTRTPRERMLRMVGTGCSHTASKTPVSMVVECMWPEYNTHGHGEHHEIERYRARGRKRARDSGVPGQGEQKTRQQRSSLTDPPLASATCAPSRRHPSPSSQTPRIGPECGSISATIYAWFRGQWHHKSHEGFGSARCTSPGTELAEYTP